MMNSILKRRSEILLLLFVFTFPVSIRASNIILVILIVNYCLSNDLRIEVQTLRKQLNSLVALIFPFIFILISILYSQRGIKALEKHLPLLFIPLIISLIYSKESRTTLLKTFVLSIVLMCIVCFTYGLYNFFFISAEDQRIVGDNMNSVISSWNALTNESLTRPFEINPIYMSLFVSFAFFIVLLNKSFPRVPRLFTMSFLVLFQFLIGSRIGLVAFALAVAIVLLHHGSRRKVKHFLFFGIVGSLVAVMIVYFNPVLKKRFINDFSSMAPGQSIESWNAINIRIAIWDCSIQTLKKSPVIGYGAGDQYAAREKCYQKNYSFYGPFGTDLNSHNQFLEYSLIGGLPLLLLFLLQIGYSLRIAARRKSILHLVFLILFVITCLGESLLETHKGIVFLSLFNSHFIYRKSDQPDV